MTASPTPPEQPPQVKIRFPEDRAVGEYVNGMSVWANPHELIIDYLVNVDAPGMPPTVQVVRRIRLPIAMAGDLLQNICSTMDKYEQTYGPIHKPGSQAG